MFKNILLPYDFENDFSAIPDHLAKMVDTDSIVTVYHVVEEANFATNLENYIEQKSDIIRDTESNLAPFLQELDEKKVQYKVDIDFGPVKDTILDKITSGDTDKGEYDLVIMSNHRVSLNIKHVLGDVTHKIAKRSSVPVLIVK